MTGQKLLDVRLALRRRALTCRGFLFLFVLLNTLAVPRWGRNTFIRWGATSDRICYFVGNCYKYFCRLFHIAYHWWRVSERTGTGPGFSGTRLEISIAILWHCEGDLIVSIKCCKAWRRNKWIFMRSEYNECSINLSLWVSNAAMG